MQEPRSFYFLHHGLGWYQVYPSGESSAVASGNRDPEKEKCWRELIARWRSSGLNKSQFCAQEKVNISSFNSWISVIADRDLELRREQLIQQRDKRLVQRKMVRREQKKRSLSAEFVEAQVSSHSPLSDTEEENVDRIVVTTPDRFVIKLSGSTSSAFLIAVPQALR